MNKLLDSYFSNEEYIIVYDMDGTLTEARWGDLDISFLEETPEIALEKHWNGHTSNLVPLPFMQKIVTALASERQFLLSGVMDSIEVRNKDRVLDQCFPNIKRDNRFYTRDTKEKLYTLKCIHKQMRSSCVYISDSLEELIYLNKEFRKAGIKDVFFFHTSSLFT